jgi:signal transduction histidine kinase
MEVCVGRIQQASISTLSPRDVDLRELIQRIAGHFQQSSRQHLISVELDALPTSFHCDPKLVGILLSNLLENAARHAPEGGVIWVTGRRTADDAVEIAIMDEGPGIPAAEQARIFERYTQGDAAATRKQGMGLGLFIVRRIAEMHGGKAVCESEPGEGSTFRVTLRRCSAEDPAL